MCWVGAKEFDRCWRAELINRTDEQMFDVVPEAMDNVDPARRGKCVFMLTIWKSRDGLLNVLNYRKGFSYRFEKVQSLKLVYGNPVGCMQIRERLRAIPLPPPGFEASNPQRTSGNTSDASVQEPRDMGENTPARAPNDLARAVIPSAKTALKRKTRKDYDKSNDKITANEQAPEAPTKKSRKSCAKELCFASPTKKPSSG
ncbi:hypothetical protein PHYPSEUDO_014623 [Phytophthora pseudosyringae]|uniref:Uncharacterized protein n=1 Tax=Phytophthora pseudosyringae TaxID=221518 RepID=A0A8T1V526_9STRA|nr:hypothetical protein PHYPSEUDO_014623 [Phytophthora pseudosyringae]